MNKIHEKKPNQLVFDYKYSDIGILPTMKELTQDEIYKKYIRKSLAWYKYQNYKKWLRINKDYFNKQKGVK